jgi:hypothetical protein
MLTLVALLAAFFVPFGAITEAASPLEAALKRARQSPEIPFRLGVLCSNREAVRRMEVYAGGTAVWAGRVQVALPREVRSALLDELLARRFDALRPSYGGKPAPVAPTASLRVTCRVVLAVEGVEKSSVQLAYGEQSAELAALANALLDRVQPLAARGTTARDLADGLAKIAEGTLAPELLAIRFLELPPDTPATAGSIVRLEERRLSRRDYAPGREIGAETTRELPAERVRELAATLRQAGFDGLPLNLSAESQIEVEVALLEHRKTVLARQFGRLAPAPAPDARARFEQVLSALRALGSALAP